MKKTLRDLYCFPGFRTRVILKPHPKDNGGYIITLERRQKKQSVRVAEQLFMDIEIAGLTWSGILMPGQPASTLNSSTAEFYALSAKP